MSENSDKPVAPDCDCFKDPEFIDSVFEWAGQSIANILDQIYDGIESNHLCMEGGVWFLQSMVIRMVADSAIIRRSNGNLDLSPLDPKLLREEMNRWVVDLNRMVDRAEHIWNKMTPEQRAGTKSPLHAFVPQGKAN